MQRAIPRDPSPPFQLRCAQAAFDLGQCEEARAAVLKMLRNDKTHVGALELLAKIQWRRAELQPLLGTLDRLLALNPYEPGYHYLKGSAFHCLSRFGEALKAYARCKQLGPSPLDRDAGLAIEALRECQISLLAQLLRDDMVFRARYGQDPEAACESVGIELREESTEVVHYPSPGPLPLVVWSRPS